MASASEHGSFARSVLLARGSSPRPLFAQQTGAITGTVTATDGSLLPGVTVEARPTSSRGPRDDGHRRQRRVPPARAAAGHATR